VSILLNDGVDFIIFISWFRRFIFCIGLLLVRFIFRFLCTSPYANCLLKTTSNKLPFICYIQHTFHSRYLPFVHLNKILVERDFDENASLFSAMVVLIQRSMFSAQSARSSILPRQRVFLHFAEHSVCACNSHKESCLCCLKGG